MTWSWSADVDINESWPVYAQSFSRSRDSAAPSAGFTDGQSRSGDRPHRKPALLRHPGGTLALELWASTTLLRRRMAKAFSWPVVIGTLAGQTEQRDCPSAPSGSTARSGPSDPDVAVVPAGYVTRDFRELSRRARRCGRGGTATAKKPKRLSAPKGHPAEGCKALRQGGGSVCDRRLGRSIPPPRRRSPRSKGSAMLWPRASSPPGRIGQVDDLLKVKGMGPKLLERVRNAFTL